MNNQTVVNLVDIIPDLPLIVKDEVVRDALITAINKFFDEMVNIVFLNGDENVGKTTLASQFCRSKPSSCFGLFLGSANSYSFEIPNIRWGLYSQLKWVLDGVRGDPQFEPSDKDIRYMINVLQRRAHTVNEKYYFVVDGLAEVPEDIYEKVKDYIFEIMPIGAKNIGVLVTGDSSGVDKYNLNKKISKRSVLCTSFGWGETRDYFGGMVEKEKLESIHKVCKGNPGYLASAKRLIESGQDFGEDLSRLPDALPELFEMEWEDVLKKGGIAESVLSVAAFALSPFSTKEIAGLLAVENECVDNVVESLSFVDKDDSGFVFFVNNAYKRFACKKLEKKKKPITETIVDDFMSRPDDDDTIQYLPKYLSKNGRKEELLKVLDGSHLIRLMSKNKSISSLLEYVDYGIGAAGNGEEGYRLHLAKSSIYSLTGAVASRSEVLAALALGNEEKAFFIAESAPVDEDRLYLLSAIARECNGWPEESKQQLANNIEVISRRVNPALIGEERCAEIAADIFGICPEVAIDMVEGSLDKNEKNTRDWALTRLSFNVLSRGSESTENDAIDIVKSRISDVRFRDFFNAAEKVINSDSPDVFKSVVEKLKRNSDKLLFMRQWCGLNRKSPLSYLVTREAIDVAISDTDFVPSATFYNDISITLPYASNKKSVKDIIHLIDGQKGIVREKGPTREFVQLQLVLAEAEKSYSYSACFDRVADLYLGYVDCIEDIVVKANCLASMMAFLSKVDKSKKMESEEGLHSSIKKDFLLAFDEALLCTADQAETFGQLVSVLANEFPVEALRICQSLNTVWRRDEAYTCFIDEVISNDDENINWESVKKALLRIKSPDSYDDAVHAVCERIAFLELGEFGLKVADEYIEYAYKIKRPSVRARSLVCILSYYSNGDASVGRQESIKNKVYEAWSSIDTPWIKIDTGFKICADVVSVDKELAKLYWEKSEALKTEVGSAESEDSSTAEFYATRLAIRSFYALVVSGKNTPNDLAKIEQVIACTECCGAKASHWSLVSLAYYMAGQEQESKRIFFKHVQPGIVSLKKVNKAAADKITLLCAPAWWAAHEGSAIEEAESLGWPYSDRFFYRVGKFILEKVWPDDPYHANPSEHYNIDYTDCLALINIIDRIENDSGAAEIIRNLVHSVCNLYKKAKITGEQKGLIVSKVELLIDNKFPSYGYISHNGYQIYLKSYLSCLKPMNWPEWESIISEAKCIPNSSDRVFVLSAIIENIPSKHKTHRDALILDVMSMVSNIRSSSDKLGRYYNMAEMFWSVDAAVARKCIKEGLLKSANDDCSSAASRQRDLIDLAHKVDPSLPDQIISSNDADPARKKIRESIDRQSEVIDFRKSLVSDKGDYQDLIKKNKDALPRASWKNLGLLHAGKASQLTASQCMAISRSASDFSLVMSFPVYSWIIESIRLRYAKTPQANDYIRPLFDSFCDNVLLLEGMVRIAFGDEGGVSLQESVSPSGENSVLIGKGDRDKALALISDWLYENKPEEIFWSDPYFCPESLEMIYLVSKSSPDSSVWVLTSLKTQQDKNLTDNIQDKYKSAWGRQYGEISHPQTDIAVLGMEGSGGSPIHDRWIVSNVGGIRIGTSFKSLGGDKDSEISFMGADECLSVRRNLEGYLFRRVKEKDGRKIRVSFFGL
ncbi:hypothetical protein [Alcanivorax sp.]|uniref:hypothetical protein n=1 Tax=Alcanivorax sp. TaxID=1872427 RepID=UPI002B2798C3|nr:hypothetical protein [Alcanivorax sp.]